MKENWRQAGGKRLLALVLTLVLMVGIMPLGSAKAAGEVDATLTYGGFTDQPDKADGRWLIYADLSAEITATLRADRWLGSVDASMNGSSEFSLDVYVVSTSTKRIFYTLSYSQLGVSAPSELAVGTTVTLKARTMPGYLNVKNDFTIYWTGSEWKELRKLGMSTVSSQQQAVLTTTNTELQTLFDSRGSTADMPLRGVGDACVYLNGNPTTKTTVNYSRWGLYLDAATIKGSNYAVGDVLRVKGIFSQTVNPKVYYAMDESFVCTSISGTTTATWAYRSDLSIKSNTTGTLYLSAGEIVAKESDYNVFGGTGAILTYNGTAISRASNNYFLYSANNGGLRIYLQEYGITQQNEGDTIYIAGTFSCNGKQVNFGENWFVLQSDGTWLHTSEEPEPTEINFTITKGSYLFQDWSNLNRWSMIFDTSKSLGMPSELTYLGMYKIVVSGEEKTAPFYVTTSGKLQIFVGQAIVPQNPEEGTIVTISAQKLREDCVLTEDYSIIFEQGQWKNISYRFEDLTVISLEELLTAVSQDTTSLHRWIFKMKPSVALEAATAGGGTNLVGYNGSMNVRIYHKDTPDIITSTTSTALHAQWQDEDGYFGLIINFTELPKDADGYVMVIEPGIFRSANHIYKLEKEFRIENTGGVWEIPQVRPEGTGVRGDANGDGVVDVRDIVREKLELAGLTGKSGIALCTKDALIHKTERLTQEDLISLYEIILRGNGSDNTMPVYLDDNKIILAAYEGPRSGGKTNYHYANGSLVNDGTVTKSYVNSKEFQRFADAGLNTVYVQADASFDSMALKGANTAMLKNLNTYMELAAEAGVDVIAYSDYLNAYLKGESSKTWAGTELAMNEENLVIELEELWNGHAAAKGMKEYSNFKGIMMSDELESNRLGAYKTAADVIKGVSSDIGLYSSQYSMTAGDSHFADFGGSTVTAAERFTNSAKAFGTVAGNFAYDMYPLRTNSSGSTSSVTKEWLYNLQLLAEAGRDNGFDTGVTVQSMGQVRTPIFHEYLRDPKNKEDIGFQVYTALAYGMKSITYYTYWEHHAQYATTNAYEAYTNAMVLYPDDPEVENAEGVETDVYRAVSAVNNEINQFDHVFMEYDWLGTMALKGSNKDRLYNDLSSYTSDRITSATATNDALIGCMYDAVQGYDGFWLVNGTAPHNAGDAAITVKFVDGVGSLLVYDPTEAGFDGKTKIVSYDAANGYTATLKCGEGQFVIPLWNSAAENGLTLIACSDFQNSGGDAAGQATVSGILNSMKADGITSADGFFCCGDYTTASNFDDIHPTEVQKPYVESGIAALKASVSSVVSENLVMVQGNHDNADAAGLAASGKNDPLSGAYGVFVINEDDYMWGGRYPDTVKATAQNLIDYLNEKLAAGYEKPVFVVSHLPLHYSMRTKTQGDGKDAKYIFDALNEAGKKGLNIFFLFGHDHSNGWDDYLGGGSVCLKKGDAINIAQNSQTNFKTETLAFTYMNAGYVGHYAVANTGVDSELTMTVFKITGNQVQVTRYDSAGKHDLKSEGVVNASKGENGYPVNSKVYASPQVVRLTRVTDRAPIKSLTSMALLIDLQDKRYAYKAVS